MNYVSVPEYKIDLTLPEHRRWGEVIETEGDLPGIMMRAALKDFREDYDTSLGESPTLQWLFASAYRIGGGLYVEEMRSWAKAMKTRLSTLVTANCIYELSHMGELTMTPFGCTAGIRWVNGLGMVHLRNMDWPVTQIGDATRIFRFVDGGREFVTVGVLGMTGVISGMLPGEYSVTINWAPPTKRPKFRFGPSFLLREVLTKCDTYEEAVDVLATTPLSTSVFFTVCGAERNKACVIERTPLNHYRRDIGRSPLVQANHYVGPPFFGANNVMKEDIGNGTSLDDSKWRHRELFQNLKGIGSVSELDELYDCIGDYPIENENSYQQMIFSPSSGEMRAWRLAS